LRKKVTGEEEEDHAHPAVDEEDAAGYGVPVVGEAETSPETGNTQRHRRR
jgi:hypothetical protein